MRSACVVRTRFVHNILVGLDWGSQDPQDPAPPATPLLRPCWFRIILPTSRDVCGWHRWSNESGSRRRRRRLVESTEMRSYRLRRLVALATALCVATMPAESGRGGVGRRAARRPHHSPTPLAIWIDHQQIQRLVGTRRRALVQPPPTHPFNGPFSGTTRVSRYQEGKPIWILLKQETVSGSGISWAQCKSAPRSRQITMPATHHSVF